MDSVKPKWTANPMGGNEEDQLPEDEVNEYSFQESVAKIILFRAIDKCVMRQPWYRGYKANIVSYTLAKFRQELEDRGLVLDLKSIWNTQVVPDRMMEYLLRIAEVASERLHMVDGHETGNPSEKAKTAAFWQGFRLVRIDPTYDLSRDCVELARRDRDFAAACAKQREERSARNRAIAMGAEWWRMLAEWTKSHLSEYYSMHERLLAKAANPLRIGIMSRQECALLVNLEKYARENGFDN